jgi:general secretion pathway protein L
MNLSNNIDFDLKGFFLWWGRELSFWIPERLKQALSDKTGHVFLHISAEKMKFSSLKEGQRKTIVELAFNEQGLAQAQKLLEENEYVKKAHLILRLSSKQAIKKILYLPTAAKENIRQVVSFELDKYTPFNSEQVYFALKPLGKEENGQIKVLLVLTPREILDAIYLKLNSAEIYPDIVDYVEEANNFTEDLEIYNLLPEWERPVKNRVVQTLTWLFSFILLALTVAVFVFPVWHEARNVDSLKQQKILNLFSSSNWKLIKLLMKQNS